MADTVAKVYSHQVRIVIALTLACLAGSCAPLPEAVAIEGSCSITDGDTIRCGDERIRLLGIDAPEVHGCRAGRTCVEGDGAASTRSLERGAMLGPLTIVRMSTDRYGRTLALVRAGGQDLSCWQLQQGQAEYVERWDNRRAVARSCPTLVR